MVRAAPTGAAFLCPVDIGNATYIRYNRLTIILELFQELAGAYFYNLLIAHRLADAQHRAALSRPAHRLAQVPVTPNFVGTTTGGFFR